MNYKSDTVQNRMVHDKYNGNIELYKYNGAQADAPESIFFDRIVSKKFKKKYLYVYNTNNISPYFKIDSVITSLKDDFNNILEFNNSNLENEYYTKKELSKIYKEKELAFKCNYCGNIHLYKIKNLYQSIYRIITKQKDKIILCPKLGAKTLKEYKKMNFGNKQINTNNSEENKDINFIRILSKVAKNYGFEDKSDNNTNNTDLLLLDHNNRMYFVIDFNLDKIKASDREYIYSKKKNYKYINIQKDDFIYKLILDKYNELGNEQIKKENDDEIIYLRNRVNELKNKLKNIKQREDTLSNNDIQSKAEEDNKINKAKDSEEQENIIDEKLNNNSSNSNNLVININGNLGDNKSITINLNK